MGFWSNKNVANITRFFQMFPLYCASPNFHIHYWRPQWIWNATSLILGYPQSNHFVCVLSQDSDGWLFKHRFVFVNANHVRTRRLQWELMNISLEQEFEFFSFSQTLFWDFLGQRLLLTSNSHFMVWVFQSLNCIFQLRDSQFFYS